MGRLRSIRRAVADSPLLGIVLAVCAVFALASAQPVNLGKVSAGWATTPSLPRPLYLEAGREAMPVGASFDSHAPALRSVAFSGGQHVAVADCGRQEHYRTGLTAFAPLYRRPPPRVS